jgi:HlyD family secretion protein
MRTLAVFFIGISLLMISACGSKNSQFDASGTFEATEIIVSSEATGKILEFEVQEGMDLKVNQTVGYIDSLQLYLKKMQLLANLKTVESRRPDTKVQIASIQQQIETAKSEKLRIERLLKSNAANQKQLDDVIAQISILEKQLEAQKSSLDITNRSIGGEISAIEIQVAQLNDQLKKCKISSPINGTVLVKYAEKGEFTAMGKPLFKIADTGNMFLRAYVTSDQLTKLKIGESIKVFADFGESENKEYTGTITWISSKSEFTPKTIQTQNERANLVYAIKVAVKNDGYLKIGMYGNIKIAPPAP